MLRDAVRPFPTSSGMHTSEIHGAALTDLHHRVARGGAVEGDVPA